MCSFELQGSRIVYGSSDGALTRAMSSIAGVPKAPMSRFETETYINDRYAKMEDNLGVVRKRLNRVSLLADDAVRASLAMEMVAR